MLQIAVMEESFAVADVLLLCRYESTTDQLYNLMSEHLKLPVALKYAFSH